MRNLETKYLGLTLKNPLIVSSSGITSSVDKIKEAEKNGAGAIVIKSIFEEQINHEANSLQDIGNDYSEAFDYLQGYVSANSIDKHIQLIKDVKKAVSIPVIASINCFSDKQWSSFAKHLEEAGADALELNIYIMPNERGKSGNDIENEYFDIIKELVKNSNIPVSVKLTYQFTNMINITDRLKSIGVSGVVLFNRLYEPDIDIDKLEMTHAGVFSNSSDIRIPLRWTAIISDQTKGIDISTSTGIHDAKAFIKMILAGANTVQVCSVLYQKGISEIKNILNDVEQWMEQHHFNSLDEVRGIMSYKSIKDPAIYQRSQFMKYFSDFD